MDTEAQVAACAPLVDVIVKHTGAKVVFRPGASVLWSGGQEWNNEPLTLTVNAGDRVIERTLLHDLCHYVTACKAAREMDNLGLSYTGASWHQLWLGYNRAYGYTTTRRVVPWEFAPMCLEMDVWCEAGVVPDDTDSDMPRAAFLRMRSAVARRYLERVYAERVPEGFVRDAGAAFRASHLALRSLRAAT